MKPFLATPRKAVENLKKGVYSVGVFGFGHVGSIIGVGWGLAGARIIGMTLDRKAIRMFESGISPFPEEAYLSEHISVLRRRGLLEVTDDYHYGARKSDIKIIAVPVYLSEEKKPDLAPVVEVSKKIGEYISKGDVVIVETSLPPGTTRNLIKPILEEKSGFKADEDFALAYSPERISAGTALEDFLEKYPKIVGCDSLKSLELVSELYSAVVKKGVIKMSSTLAAETEKLFEGIYRDVNIALANELATFCEKIGVSFDEVQKAANSQPFSHLHNPGIGVGGACIPVYPYFVLEAATKHGIKLQITQLARSINEQATETFIRKIMDAVRLLQKEPVHCNFALLGLSFRGGTSDTRLSPALKILSFIEKLGASIRVCDPLVEKLEGKNYEVIKDWRKAVKGADVIIIASDHREFHEIRIGEASELAGKDLAILDGKNVINDFNAKPRYRVLYVGTGRPSFIIKPDSRKERVEI
ncbi:MAG: nucleotide sugar dehydrogenase [Candidatus Brockarchaeota archaeon]|nr:nucleotide sugar dehydrogenase [Candidatus Brockarchaeota archaeon]